MYDHENTDDEPKCSLITYVAEGHKYHSLRLYRKAIDSYSTALEFEPTNQEILIARSKCYFQIGDVKAALADAEASLVENKDFFKGLYQKAEVLYQIGDFEHALVYHHRGHKLRPEYHEFLLGIHKTQEAINHCIGNPRSVKLQNIGDLSFFNTNDDTKLNRRVPARKALSRGAGADARANQIKTETKNYIAKIFLGELYPDRQYLQQLLLKDTGLLKETVGGVTLRSLVASGMKYLDSRTEFWRQLKPIYTRKRDLPPHLQNKPKLLSQTATFAKIIEDVNQLLTDGSAVESLALARSTIEKVKKLSDTTLSNKSSVLSNFHSCIGNAYLEMGLIDEAIEQHRMDFAISKKSNCRDGLSRSFENLGRVHARDENFEEALTWWEKKIPLVKTSLESAWLFHGIGRCHLELGNSEEAKAFGKNAMAAAKKSKDDTWVLNAGVLIAQAEVMMGEYEVALGLFEQSLQIAKKEGDDAFKNDILKGIAELKQRLHPTTDTTSENTKESLETIEATTTDTSDADNEPPNAEEN